MKLLSLYMVITALCASTFAIGYGVGTGVSTKDLEGEVLSVEDCIVYSKWAAVHHEKAIEPDYGVSSEDWNLFWTNLHNSCAYWLEAVKK